MPEDAKHGSVTDRPGDPKIIALGKSLFNSKGCASCHGTDGANGDVGPDLTGEAKKGRDAAWLARYITNP